MLILTLCITLALAALFAWLPGRLCGRGLARADAKRRILNNNGLFRKNAEIRSGFQKYIGRGLGIRNLCSGYETVKAVRDPDCGSIGFDFFHRGGRGNRSQKSGGANLPDQAADIRNGRISFCSDQIILTFMIRLN